MESFLVVYAIFALLSLAILIIWIYTFRDKFTVVTVKDILLFIWLALLAISPIGVLLLIYVLWVIAPNPVIYKDTSS